MTLWTPSNLTTCVGWWDASNSGTITDDGTGHCSQWNDLSPNGNNLTPFGATKPSIAGSINGLNTLTFATSGMQKLAASGLPSTTTGMGCAAVLSPTSVATKVPINLGDHTTSNNEAMMFLYTATVWEVRTVNLSASAATKAYTDVVNPHLFSGTCTTTLRDIYTDGSQGTTQGTTEANKNSPDVSIGHQLGQAGTTNDFAGRAGEIVLFTGTSTTDRQITEGYLAWKWGLQALLPPGHPYSGGPPTLGIQINLSSVSSIAATGVFSPNNFLNLSLTGVRSSSNVGSLDKSNSINLNGIKATAQVGIFDFTHTFPNDAIAPSLIEKIRKKKKKWKGKQPEVQFKKTPDKLYIRTVEKIKRPRFRIPQNDDDEDELEIILRTLL